MGFFDKLKKINIFASFGSELTDDFTMSWRSP